MRKATTPTQGRLAKLKRLQLIPLLVVALIGAMGAVTACHSKATGGELALTAAADPGPNAFMPAAAPQPPIDTQPPPTLQPQGDGSNVETVPLPGDRDGLYGGTDNNAGVDPDKMVDFLGANPTQADAFVDALNSDPTVYWSGERRLIVADIATYLRELTPAVLRLDTRITNHGFDGTHATALQSVFQRGTAVLVDAHGVPRVRGLSGNPLTAPIALRGEPKLVGAPWPGYHPGALARVQPTTADIKNFVLVDVVTGKPFNRPAGTTGAGDTPHTEPVASPQPAPDTNAPPTKGHTLLDDIDGSYQTHQSNSPDVYALCGSGVQDYTSRITRQGNTLTIDGYTGTLNGDGSFSVTNPLGAFKRGVFATDGGRTVIHATWESGGPGAHCSGTFEGTKQ
jgi:hypothetical protein